MFFTEYFRFWLCFCCFFYFFLFMCNFFAKIERNRRCHVLYMLLRGKSRLLRLIWNVAFLSLALGNSTRLRSVLTRIRRIFRRSEREKLMRTRVAQIRRKTDYLRGALSRLMAHPRKRCFLWRRESITRPLTTRSNFTRRNESEKRSLIFIAAIMDFITRFEEKRKRLREKEKRERQIGK